MQPHADCHRPGFFRNQGLIENVQRRADPGGGVQRGEGRGAFVAQFEHGEQPVAQIFVDRAAGAGDRGYNGVKEPVEQEHDIIGQLPGGAGGKAAHVQEQDGQTPFLAQAFMRPRPPSVRAKYPKHGDRFGWAQLAGEAGVGRRIHRAKAGGFLWRGLGHIVGPVLDDDAAGGATPAPAAQRHVRHPGDARHFQKSHAAPALDLRPVHVANAQRFARAKVFAAQKNGQCQTEQCGEDRNALCGQFDQRLELGQRWHVVAGNEAGAFVGAEQAGILNPALHQKPRQGEGGDQCGKRDHHRLRAPPGRQDPQPHMQPDTGMNPDH